MTNRVQRLDALLLLLLFAAVALPLSHGSQHSQPGRVVLVSDSEPGQRLVLRGTVYAADGETPLPGVNLNVYQTDSKGYYCMLPSPERDQTLPNDNCPDEPPRKMARIRAIVTTDAQGRYEVHTIKPGSYPNSRNPAHIHIQAWGAGYPSQWPHDLHFAGDPFLPEAEVAAQAGLGKFRFICEPQPISGSKAVLCEYNFRLEREVKE